jgi:hypothetical protein
MKKIIITEFKKITIIGEYNLERNIVVDCLEIKNLSDSQLELKPILIPFSMVSPVIIHGNQLGIYVEVHPIFFASLIEDYNNIRNNQKQLVAQKIKSLATHNEQLSNYQESIH